MTWVVVTVGGTGGFGLMTVPVCAAVPSGTAGAPEGTAARLFSGRVWEHPASARSAAAGSSARAKKVVMG
jgi:hypothetical protein